MNIAYACLPLAPLSYGVGTVFQAVAVRRVGSAPHLDLRLLARLARQRWYLGGLAADAVGFVAALVALRRLPLFVVQPAIGASVGVTAAIGAAVFGFRLRTSELSAIGVLLVGLAFVGVSARAEAATRLSPFGEWVLVAAVLLVVLMGAAAARIHTASTSALALAACAGFGFTGTAIAARALQVPSPPWRLAGSPLTLAVIAYGACGILMFASALQRGAATATSAVMLAVETVVPAFVGLAVLGDRTRAHFGFVAALGFVLTIGASVALARYAELVPPAPTADAT